MNTRKIIGVGGTNGSGKDSLGNILAEKYNYLFISLTDMLRAECRERGLPVERENLRMISAEWREKGGLGAPIDKVVAAYEPQADGYAGLVTASLRNPGEADRVHELGGACLTSDPDGSMRIWGGSDEFGACDREPAAALLRSLFPATRIIVEP